MSTLVHESLAEIPEDKLVDRIVTDIQWGREFFRVERHAVWNDEQAVRAVANRPRRAPEVTSMCSSPLRTFQSRRSPTK